MKYKDENVMSSLRVPANVMRFYKKTAVERNVPVSDVYTDALKWGFPESGFADLRGGLRPGETSLPAFVRTNATFFDTNGLIRVQQGLDIEDFRGGFQPTVVPLPGGFVLFNLGLAAIGFIGQRKRSRKYKFV